MIVFVSFWKENTPKNEILRPKESEREVLEMSLSQTADTTLEIVFLKLLVVLSIARFMFSKLPPETSGLIFLFSLLLFSDETTKITIWQQKSFLCMNLKRTSKA